MRIIIFGPPGVGKGTQAVALAKQLNITHISSGDLLRQAVREGSPLGKRASEFMNKGELVPDELVGKLVLNKISGFGQKQGFILDGYPRNIHQANELDKILISQNKEIDVVIYLEANQEIIIQRLSGRRLCSNCKANFHIMNMPPKKPGICDYCGQKLYQRTDDQEDTIKHRLKVYKESSASLIDYYSRKNKMLRIVANDEAEIVLKDILKRLNDKFKISTRN